MTAQKVRAYIGADPGLSGALALYVPSIPFGGGMKIEVTDMPTMIVNEQRVIDMWSLANILAGWVESWDATATIERVHAIPNYTRKDGQRQGMSSSASFNFGKAAGALEQAFASAKIPMTLIPPATWKTVYGLRGGRENKDASRLKASQLFPAHADQWALKKHDGRAEAVLLAHYGSKLQ